MQKGNLKNPLDVYLLCLFNENIANNYSCDRKGMLLNFLLLPCYVFTMSFNDNDNGVGKYAYLIPKHSEDLIKTKMDISIFSSSLVFILT